MKIPTDISDKLLKMMDVDQNLRKSRPFIQSDVEKNDNQNTEELKKIIAEVGWPTISKVGEKPAHAAWILAQHTRDDAFKEKCLELMKANASDVSGVDIAFLEDRVSLKKYGYQIYGTQVKTVEQQGKLVTELMPVKNSGSLNELRKNIGLDTVEEQIKRCEKMYIEMTRGIK